MSEEVIGVSLQLDGNQPIKTVGSLRKELKESVATLQQLQAKFGELSPEALKAARSVAQIKDQIQDAAEVSSLFDPGKKFQALGNTVRVAAGGFSALQGSMALFGAESEDVQKTLLKVQGALALSEGVNTIADSAKDFQRLGSIIKETTLFKKADTLATKAAAAVQKLFGIEVVATSTSFKVLKGAIAATGIGLLVIGIGEIVSALQSWTSSAEEAAEKQKALNETASKFAKVGLDTELKAIDNLQRVDVARAKARGASEKEVFEIEQKYRRQKGEAQIRYWGEVKNIDAEGAQSANDEVNRINAEGTAAKFDFEAKELEKKKQKDKEALEKSKQQNKELVQNELQAQKDLRQIKEDAATAQIKDENKRAKEKIKLDYESAKIEISQRQVSEETKARLLAAERIRTNSLLQEVEDKIADENTQKQVERLKAQQEQVASASGGLSLSGQLTDEQLVERAKLAQELYDSKRQQEDLELSALDSTYRKQFELLKGNEEAQTLLSQQYEEQRYNIKKKFEDMKLQVVGNALGAAADLIGKQTAAGKALAISEAIINTYLGASQALREKSLLPQPFSTIQKIAAVASVVATGLKTVKEISKTQVPGFGGGSSAPSTGGLSAPIQPSPQVSTTQIDQNQVNQIANATVRAFVIEKDVSSNQEKIKALNRAARIG